MRQLNLGRAEVALHVAGVLCVVSLLVTISAAPSASAPQVVTPQDAGDRPTGDLAPNEQAALDELAETTIKRVCVTCHPVDNIIRNRRESMDWSKVMTNMATLGASTSTTPEQYRMIKVYLTRYYGTIRVNSAAADEFSAVLGYSPKDAAAIVAHRQAHGSFAGIEALAKVPGIDRAKLDEQPEALRFDK